MSQEPTADVLEAFKHATDTLQDTPTRTRIRDLTDRTEKNIERLRQDEVYKVTPILFDTVSKCAEALKTPESTDTLGKVLDAMCGVWILSHGCSVWCCTFDDDARIALGVLQKEYLHTHIACIQVSHARSPMIEYAYEFPGLNMYPKDVRNWLGCKLYELVWCCKIQVESESTSRVMAEILSNLPDETRCTNTLQQHITETGQVYAVFKLVRRGKHKGPTDTFATGEAVRNIAKGRLAKILTLRRDKTLPAATFMPTSWALERFTHGFGLQNGDGVCNLAKSTPDFTIEEVEQEIHNIAHTVLSHTDWKRYKLYITTGQKEYEFKHTEADPVRTDLDLDTMDFHELVNTYTQVSKARTPEKIQRVGWVMNWATSKTQHTWEHTTNTYKLAKHD